MNGFATELEKKYTPWIKRHRMITQVDTKCRPTWSVGHFNPINITVIIQYYH